MNTEPRTQNRISRFLLPLLIAILLAGRAAAQPAEDDPLALIAAAFADFAALESYRFEGERIIDQTLTVDDDTVRNLTTQRIDGSARGADERVFVQASIVVTTGDSPDAAQEGEFSFDRIRMDDTTYLRFGELVSEGQAAPLQEVPTDWFVFDIQTLGILPPATAAIIQSYAQIEVIPSLLDYTIDRTTVDAVVELPREALGDVEMRVFDVRMNPPSVYLRLEGGIAGLFASIGLDGSEVVALFENDGLQVEFRVWIGVEDGRLHQVDLYSLLVIDPAWAQIGDRPYGSDEAITYRLTFSGFNEDVLIEAPEVAGG